MATRASLYLLGRARVVQPGKCVLCGCTTGWGCTGGCLWVEGTDRRLCTAHSEPELAQARIALTEADRAERRP